MPAPRKPALPTIDPHRLALVQTVLVAAAYDQIAERSGAPGSELVLAEAGLSHTEIAAATGRNAEAVRSTIRRTQRKGRS